ncbi:class I SAM-dependent methyltransferase [Clostridium senegalense]|uniref:Class I SAM-dependent methyltransferase n=1 Tax=Clostridium senegalense TaxID=1465809 RepID=A0A6M0H090_9CLOT|nr:class I SAM-dependent methyltransferase [Clostridium senegalense]NEU04236.1 class I SAM-dependent methyltransferase [Clostridium senegalense]
MIKDKRELINLWDKVGVNFSEIGPNYWKRFGERLIELSDINAGDFVLDIGIGRGASLFPAAQRVGEKGQVIGIDISKVMVNETKKQIIKENINNIKVFQMDGEDLEFKNEYFNNVVSGFSIGYILNEDKELNKILKVLKFKGQLALSLWGVQESQNWLTDIINEYLFIHSNKGNKVKDKKEDDTVLNTVYGVKSFLKSLNLKNIKVYEEDNEVIYLDENQWWSEMWNNALRGILESIEKLGDEKFESFKLAVNKTLEKFKTEKGICFNMKVIYAYGKKE